jgi:hypothetical protein
MAFVLPTPWSPAVIAPDLSWWTDSSTASPPLRRALARSTWEDFAVMADALDEAELVELFEPRFAESYRKLGWYKGPLGTREVQDEVRRFWVTKGAEGAVWLLNRIRDEYSVDVLAAVAEIVGDIGHEDAAGVEACLDILDRDPSEEQEDVALTALRWMAAPSAGSLVARLRTAIERYLRRPDAEIQERAVLATRALPAGVAEELFAAVHDDVEEAVRDAVDEERVSRVLRT